MPEIILKGTMANDDDFAVPPVVVDEAGAGRKRGKGKVFGAGSTKTALKLCIVTECTCLCQSQMVFCAPHANSWLGLVTQAAEQGA